MPIQYPYIPPEKTIRYVPVDNSYIQEARFHALTYSLDAHHPTGSVVVLHGEVIGKGANGSDYHTRHGCERVRRNIPTGTGYELCEGCHPKNHSESRAIANAIENGFSPSEADIYVWGHWWCCEPCWKAMIEAKIDNVYLLKGSEIYFNKEHPDNLLT